ncbi:MAG: DUF1559 domain-containing protein [Planctomycetes bacterium]|nr:DUF1559 domain-containing protein [Planctomycetota bacterium]
MSGDDHQRPRGLWSVMGGGPSPAAFVTDDEPATETQQSEAPARDNPADGAAHDGPPQELRGLWSVMGLPRTAALHSSDETAPAATVDEAALAPATRADASVRRTSHGAKLSLLLGVASLPLAALALLPDFYLKFPAMAAGFLALALGMTAAGEIRRSRGRSSGMAAALVGMSLGTAGVLLGPLVFVKLGRQWRASTGRDLTRQHLEQLGLALSQYHGQHNRFPAGEIVGVDADGDDLPLHAWTTALLPYLGEEARHRQVDFRLPWNADENYEPLRGEVAAFFAGGVQQRSVVLGPRKYGAAHFAGLGGPGEAETGFANLGIFDRNSAVSKGDVTDGLSQTLIVGEIGHERNFRPWAEPGNLRIIGRGLNRDLSGFGNAAGTGATFLHADGSVKFYANDVAPDILRRLSTRDGDE